MLSNTLVTNEVKDSTGAETEFQRLATGPGRTTEFSVLNENPKFPHRIRIKHTEIGTGINMRRRSNITIDKDVLGGSGTSRNVVGSFTLDIPVGDISSLADAFVVVANMLSFCATDGTGTTVLFNGTGNGAQVLINGTL